MNKFYLEHIELYDQTPRKSEGMFRSKKKSIESQTKENSENSYVRRGNICEVCFVARSKSGVCNC